jgi:hypothetical protein
MRVRGVMSYTIEQTQVCDGCDERFYRVMRPPPWQKHKPDVPWYCPRCKPRHANPHYHKIADDYRDATTPQLIAAAREACRNSMANTAVGAWLAVVLERLESEHQNAIGKAH